MKVVLKKNYTLARYLKKNYTLACYFKNLVCRVKKGINKG
jgi:hypothetical protein